MWQLYFPLQLPDHRPFPWLSDLFTQSGVAVGLATYSVVFIQLFFMPLLLNKITKPIVIVLAIGMHLNTALVMALPWSSFAMIALIAIFISDHAHSVIDRWLRVLLAPVGDWFYARYYDALDVVDTLRERFDDLRYWAVDQIDKIRYR